MKKTLLLLASLFIGKVQAQDVAATRYARYDHVALQDLPGNGQNVVAELPVGEAVQVLSQPAAVPHVSKMTMQQYVFVRHASEQGWVSRTALVGSLDSVAAAQPVAVATTGATTEGVYVPVTEAKRPYSAGGKVVHTVGTGARKPNYRPASTRTARSSSAAHQYTTGPRGGCYYLNSSGNKVYVDHSYCQ